MIHLSVAKHHSIDRYDPRWDAAIENVSLMHEIYATMVMDLIVKMEGGYQDVH